MAMGLGGIRIAAAAASGTTWEQQGLMVGFLTFPWPRPLWHAVPPLYHQGLLDAVKWPLVEK